MALTDNATSRHGSAIDLVTAGGRLVCGRRSGVCVAR